MNMNLLFFFFLSASHKEPKDDLEVNILHTVKKGQLQSNSSWAHILGLKQCIIFKLLLLFSGSV